MRKDDDGRLVIAYIILLLVLIENISAVTYYNSIATYLFFILWTSQIEIKKEEGLYDEHIQKEFGQVNNQGEIEHYRS